ncbi:MAG: chloride channel protein [Lachnospiraceae bacterium]|nr:chloride channel protein [Lachnospiraceae bacterium]
MKSANTYWITFLKWVVLAVLIGVICGLVGTLFYYAVKNVTLFREQNVWILLCMPLAGIFIVKLYHVFGLIQDRGTNLVIGSIRSGENVPLRMSALIFIGTVFTHLVGGSSGREGAALQIGGSIGNFLGRKFHFGEKEKIICTMCGMSAVFSAIFGTPITATVFSMEVISVGVMYYSALVPCMTSALMAYFISNRLKVQGESFAFENPLDFDLLSFAKVMVFGVCCALISILFCIAMHKVGEFLNKKFKNPYYRILVGSFVVILLTIALQTMDYNGAGMEIVEKAIHGEAEWFAFLLKILFTAVTLGCGFKGGEIVPSFFIGATFGCVVAPLLGIPAGFGAALGMIGVFCGVVNCPLASIILSIEMFGSQSLIFFAIISAVSFMLSGRYSLYSSQKIIYSKLKPEYVNRDTK